MTPNAPGQFLGYTIQLPRALFHLLGTSPGEIVSIEVLGDVAIINAEGLVNTEEDKSSVTGNPLTNRSTDLWKTFFNWIQAVNNKDLLLEKTYFTLFTNQKGRSGIVNKFSAAQDAEEAKKVLAEVKIELTDIDDKHEIWEYFDYVVNQNEKLLLKLIPRFELDIAGDYGYEQIRERVRQKFVTSSQIDFIIQNLSGWLQRVVIEKISNNEQANIKNEDFITEFVAFFSRARRRELVDFTLQSPIQSGDIRKSIKEQPLYLKQLESIEINNEDDIIQAVTDFIRAKVNRDKWIEEEIIDEETASDFEQKLEAFWINKKRILSLTERNISALEIGKLLYYECQIRQEQIRDMPPPAKTIAGTYHALANEPTLGWHPDWEKKFKS